MMPAFLVTFFQVKKVTTLQQRNILELKEETKQQLRKKKRQGGAVVSTISYRWMINKIL